MKFCKHLQENNQDYFVHMRDAWKFSIKSFAASIAFFFHGIMPFTFQHSGGKLVNSVNNTIKQKSTNLI